MKIISLFLLANLLATTDTISQSQLWGNLERGPFQVGFRVIYTYDYSRPPISDEDLKGKITYADSDAPGRQMQISLWYPASGGGKRMIYKDYIDELGKEIDFRALDEHRKAAAIDKVVGLYQDYQQNSPFKKEELSKLMSIPVAASRDAKPASGRYPVLVYPHWFSPMDGSIMSEYLASQGFVVVTTSLKGTDSVNPEITPRGLKSLAADVNFIINELGGLSFADVSKVATIGVGINATGVLTAMKDTSSIDAFISMEGGIITSSEMQMFQQTGNVNLVALAKPMLFISAPHASVKPELADYFKYADRHYIEYARMSEYYFLNNGMLESIIPGIIGTPPGDVKAGFESASRNVAYFLKHALKGDAEAKAKLEAHENDEIKKSFKKGLPTPPDLDGLKVLCASDGAAGLRTAYQSLVASHDTQPFSQSVLADLYSWLGFRRDDDYSIRTAVCDVWLESYPSSSRGNYTMARLLQAQNKKSEAAEYYRKALSLLAADKDIYLDNILRTRIQTISSEALAN